MSGTAKAAQELEALFAVPDRFWAGQRLCDPRCGMFFGQAPQMSFTAPFMTPRGDDLTVDVSRSRAREDPQYAFIIHMLPIMLKFVLASYKMYCLPHSSSFIYITERLNLIPPSVLC